MIRVCFRYDDRRLFSRAVCLVRGGDSAHCEVAHDWISDRHACVSASFLDGGVRGKTIDMPAKKWRIYEGPGDRVEVLAWLSANDGCWYDVPGLLGFIWPLLRHVRRWWFCSEACARLAFKHPRPHRIDVRDLEWMCQSHPAWKRVQ